MKSRSTNQSEVLNSAAPVKGLESLQFTGTTTTNGATTVGVNLNAGKGPREGWNLGANYDINGGTVSGSVGYTDPGTGFGLTSTIDRNGLSTSGQLNGINLATNGPDGFVMEEMNWAEQNINLAQDRTNDLRDDATLKAAGFSDEQIANMKPQDRADLLAIATADQVLRDEGGYSQDAIKKMTADQRQKLAADLTRPAFDPEAIAVGAAASVGTFFAGAFAFAGGTTGTGTGQTPTNTRADGPVVGRRPKREENGVDENLVADNRSKRNTSQDPRLPKAIRENTGDYYDPRMDPDYQPRETAESRGTVDMSRVWSTSDLKNKDTSALVRSVANNVGRLDRTNLTPIAGSAPMKRSVDIVGDALGVNPMKSKEIARLQESVGNSKRDVVIESANRIKQGIGTDKDRIIAGFDAKKSEINREIVRLGGIDRLSGREQTNPEIAKKIAELTKLEKDFNKAISADLSRKLSENPALTGLVPNKAFDDAIKARDVQDARMVALSEDMQRLGMDTYKKELDKLIADPAYKQAQEKFKIAQKQYEAQLNGLLKNVDVTKPNPFTPDVLSRISKDYVEMTKVARPEIKEFNLYRDANGNQVLMPSANPQDNRQFVRSVQERQFFDKAESLNKDNKIKINPSSGIITHGVDGSPLEPNDNAGRKAAFDKVKAQIPDFNPATNPSHAKMEAVNNFRESIDPNTKLPLDRFETTVNGVLITTMNKGGDLGLDAVRLSNGSSWMDLARIAKEVGAKEISINSIIKDGSHGKGYAMDVGSIKFPGASVAEPISYSRLNDNHLEEPSPKMKDFLSKIRDLPSTTFYATPWEVRMAAGGVIYPNLFSAVDADLWSIDNIKPDTKLTDTQLEKIFSQMAEASPEPKLNPSSARDRDIMTQMWNHRHHLHVSEVGGSQHAD
jgi:hypothetical protein